ncbi:MAG TPA: hypothetical protein VGB55_08630 [Tepidisphaeraceae bacterium]|jgi:hypothetical protein
MPILPRTPDERVKFVQNRISLWTANATQIGLLPADVTALSAKATAAAAAMSAAQVARDNAKSLTLAADGAVDAMVRDAAEAIKKIKVKATETGGNTVYELSNIPAPATPTARPAPGQPSDFKVTLTQLGALDMSWKCKNPAGTSGTLYQVYRRIGENGTPVHIGASGNKTFIDNTLPAGTSTVVYQIQAIRSTVGGPFASFTVQFGQPANGAASMSVSQSNATSPKIAA